MQTKAKSKNASSVLHDSEEPLMCKPQKYKFKFTSERELNGESSLCRIATITLLVLTSIALPILSLLNYLKFIHHTFRIPIYAWAIYIVVFNTVVLILLGKFLTSSIAYPYSNRFFTSHLKRTSNQRFGMEFSRCVERMTRMIKETTERQNSQNQSNIMLGKDEDDSDEDMNEDENSLKNLSPKDIYMRVASNIELIELYASINEQLIRDNPRRQSALFRRTTASLTGIKETLDRLELKVTFQHIWFPVGKFHSFWGFFNRFNVETEKKDQAINVKKFFVRYQPPEILKTEQNLQQLQRLILFTDEFRECVNQSVRGSCCLCNCSDQLFGRNDQAKLILKKTFEGRQYDVEGPDGNTLDCMFFPCTQKEEVVLYPDVRSSFTQIPSDLLPKYTQKPTVLMCSPNALVYQQMVIGPNAYWLNFFLKRDINVICWNYRGYGESKISWRDFLSPSKSKCDAERVLAGSIELLQLEGKIGVYGRSIGGITANHLAATYKDLIEILIIDRSLNELQGVAESKLRGSTTTTLFKQFTNGWVCKNSENYLKADRTFKIITCDPLDDTIDQFVSTMAGVGQIHAKKDYSKRDYVLFYQSLIYLIDLEDAQFTSYSWQYNEYPEFLTNCAQKVEEDLLRKSKRVSETNIDTLLTDNEIGASGKQRLGTLLPFNLEFLNQRKNQIKVQDGPFFKILYVLAVIVSDLQAATVKLRDVIAVLKKPEFQDFKLFLQLAEVFGSGYEDDVDFNRSNLRQTQTHSESMIIQLQRIIQAYDLAISTLDAQRQENLIGGLAIYHEEFERFIHFQQRMFKNLLLIQKEENLGDNNDFKKSIQGHLVQFACGHRGQPSRIEEKRISRLLRKSGFIPMLDDLPPVQTKQVQTVPKQPVKPTSQPIRPLQPEQNIKIVGGGSLQRPDTKLKLSVIEEAQAPDNSSQLEHDDFDGAGQDSDEEKIKEVGIEIEDLNESLNNSFADEKETNNLMRDKQANAMSVNLQATDTMFFGIDQAQSTRQTYIPVFAGQRQQPDRRQRNMSVAQFGSMKVHDLSNDISDKESTNLARSRNMSVISQSKTIGFE